VGFEARRCNACSQAQKIIAFADIYGDGARHRAIEDAIDFIALSSDYIAHSLESRGRLKSPAAKPLSLTRRADLLELDLAAPDLSIYDAPRALLKRCASVQCTFRFVGARGTSCVELAAGR